MATQSSQSVAARLGYGLGRGVRFFVVDENVVLRWIKRTILIGLIVIFIAFVGSVMMGAVITVGVMFLSVSLMSKFSDPRQPDDQSDSEDSHPSDFESLWDTNGSDSLWHGEDDPSSLANMNDPLFLHETHFNWDKETDYNSDK
ncbi:hypothetical protein [Pseudomonas helleri]|uniref:hypothetical protein n=1 Tax=Pseudomonas helleri TaxID=1608996 RepID=UPI00242FEFF9|nr:hypothetical protein [Pseudomonas helleri]